MKTSQTSDEGQGHGTGWALTANSICHGASGFFGGCWAAKLMAADQALDAVSIIKVILLAGGVTGGLILLSSLALNVLPKLAPNNRRTMAMVIFSTYAVFGTLSAIASAAVIGEGSGRAAYWQDGLEAMKDDVDREKDLTAQIYAVLPIVDNCTATATDMGLREYASGAVSGEGGNVGPVVTEIASIQSACRTAMQTLIASRAATNDLFVEMDRIVEKARRVADDRELNPKDAAVELVSLSNDLARLGKDVNQAIPIASLDAVAKAVSKDRTAMGLPAASVAVLQANFKPVSIALGTGLDKIAEQLAVPFKTIKHHVNAMDYLVMYPLSLLPALAASLLLELIPIIVVICALLARREEDDYWETYSRGRR